MQSITGAQIKAARAILDWSQDDLAAACNLSRTTIRQIEMGFAPRISSMKEICHSFENNGIEFLEDEGVKRRSKDVRSFRGPNSCDRFFENVLVDLGAQGGELIGYLATQDILLKKSGISQRNNLERLNTLRTKMPVRCLLGEAPANQDLMHKIHMRLVGTEDYIPSSYFNYADRWVSANCDDDGNFFFVIFRKTRFSHTCRIRFDKLWSQGSSPL